MLVMVCTEGAWAQNPKVKNVQKTPHNESVGIKQTAENKRLRNELASIKENQSKRPLPTLKRLHRNAELMRPPE